MEIVKYKTTNNAGYLFHIFLLVYGAILANVIWVSNRLHADAWCTITGATINSYRRALYWGIAVFFTVGIADMLVNGISQIIGAIWIILESMLFFGAIVATVTSYFIRPLQRPSKQIIDTIEYNLEQLDCLSVEESVLIKETSIMHLFTQ